MNAVGIDVSKGKSTVAVMQPFGVVVASPFEISHNGQELKELVERLKLLPGETKVVMEYTGNYYEPIARYLHNEGIYVSVVNAMLLHNYSGNSIEVEMYLLAASDRNILVDPDAAQMVDQLVGGHIESQPVVSVFNRKSYHIKPSTSAFRYRS